MPTESLPRSPLPTGPRHGDVWTLPYWLVIVTCRIVLACVARVRVATRLKLPHGPYLVACNHTSHFDPPVASICTGRKMDFMAVREIFSHPVADWLFRKCDVFPVSRDRIDTGAVRTAVRRLRAGRIVFLFPEGGIRSGKTSVLGGAPLPGGAAALAQMAGVPIRPAIILGSDQFYQWQALWKRPRVFMAFGDALQLDPSLDSAAAREDLNERLRRSWLALHEVVKQQPGYHPGVEPRTAQERWGERP